MITLFAKKQKVKLFRVDTFFNPRESEKFTKHIEKRLVTTYWFLLFPVYQCEKHLGNDI